MKKPVLERTQEHGGIFFSFFLFILCGTILGVGCVAFQKLTTFNPLTVSFFEKEPPALLWDNLPKGIGTEPIQVQLQALDKDAGLDQILVRLVQGNQAKTVYQKTFRSEVKNSHNISITLNPKAAQLKEGSVELQAIAFDKALWNNGTKITHKLDINFHKPHISVITPQQNGVLGGAELVFYKVTGTTPESQGVLTDGVLYPGFAAQGWSPTFQSRPSVYLTLYPIRQSLGTRKPTMQIYARDAVGNVVTANFPHRTRKKRWATHRSRINIEQARSLAAQLRQFASQSGITLSNTSSISDELKSLAKELAAYDEKVLSDTLSRPGPTRLWQDYFLIPVQVSSSNSTGDLRILSVGSEEILRARENGVRFTVSRPFSVLAANSGKVLYTGKLGLLGTTLILDHGMGLTTLYSHLSHTSPKVGETVHRGQVIGTTGRSGLATSNELYFQVRIHGVPVSPREWWDKRWVSEHIDEKIAYVLRSAP